MNVGKSATYRKYMGRIIGRIALIWLFYFTTLLYMRKNEHHKHFVLF